MGSCWHLSSLNSVASIRDRAWPSNNTKRQSIISEHTYSQLDSVNGRSCTTGGTPTLTKCGVTVHSYTVHNISLSKFVRARIQLWEIGEQGWRAPAEASTAYTHLRRRGWCRWAPSWARWAAPPRRWCSWTTVRCSAAPLRWTSAGSPAHARSRPETIFELYSVL